MCPQVVAPRAGAWIETTLHLRNSLLQVSHPVRVRGLKQNKSPAIGRSNRSHPVRVRGLKLALVQLCFLSKTVAPRAGAWIETPKTCEIGIIAVSHPVRVRGLKLWENWFLRYKKKSHPVRVRGLKHISAYIYGRNVLSHPVRVRGLKQR